MNLACCCSEQTDVPESIDVIMNDLRHVRFGGGSSMAWTSHHNDGRTGLVRVNEAPNTQIYRDEIPQHHVGPLIKTTGGIFQHDSARIHITRDYQ